MTPKQIKNKRKAIETKINRLKYDIEIQKILLKNLQSECEHKNGQHLTSMCESEFVCGDCGMGS
jgi:hypothetical protein